MEDNRVIQKLIDTNFKSNNSISILDLGSSLPFTVSNNIDNPAIDFITCVDNESFVELTYCLEEKYITEDSKSLKFIAEKNEDKAFYAFYETTSKNIKISKEEFHKKTKFHTETDIRDFLNQEHQRKYDLIILSHILHFTVFDDYINEILQKIKTRFLNSKGIIFIAVNHTDNNENIAERFGKKTPRTQSEYESLLTDFSFYRKTDIDYEFTYKNKK